MHVCLLVPAVHALLHVMTLTNADQYGRGGEAMIRDKDIYTLNQPCLPLTLEHGNGSFPTNVC